MNESAQLLLSMSVFTIACAAPFVTLVITDHYWWAAAAAVMGALVFDSVRVNYKKKAK